MALAEHKGKVTVFVPHYAMSGGTLIAMAAQEIVMDRNAVLGPVDPQIGGVAASSILQVVQKAVYASTLVNVNVLQGAAWLFSGGVALKDAAAPATDLETVITPASSSNKVLLEAMVFGGNASAIALPVIGVWRDAISTTEVLAVAQVTAEKGDVTGCYLSYLDSPASTSALTYRWRAGRGSATTWTVGGPSTVNFNGKMFGWVRATEVKG
jgi:hypothetical protein